MGKDYARAYFPLNASVSCFEGYDDIIPRLLAFVDAEWPWDAAFKADGL